MKKKILTVIPVCFLLLGCDLWQPSPGKEYGSLILTLSSSETAAKDILPPLDMDIAYYDVSGDGPGTAVFSHSGLTGPTVIEDSLIAGAWMITVDALNDDDYLIGTGSKGVSISAGETTEAEISVAPLEGTGSLDIEVSWPSGTITGPDLSGTLAAIGGTPQDIPFTLGTDSAAYSYPSLDVGYYLLSLELEDGDGAHRWGAAEWVRILKDQTTQATFTLTEQQVNSH